MDKWEEKEIGDCIVEIQTGKTPPKSNKAYYENSSVDWFSPSDFDDDIKELSNSKNKISELAVAENKAKIYPLNSLLLVGIGATIGKVGLLKYTASSNQQITALTFQENINVDFAYYWFRNLKGHIINMSSSATMPIINQKEIKKLPFRYPKSLPEQQRIVKKLDALFAKIDQAMGLLEENIAHTQALMGSVLDAEFGKLENLYSKKDILKNLTNKIGSGSTPRGGQKSYKENGISLIRSMNVHDCYFKEKNLAFIDKEQAYKLKNVEIQENDVLLNITGASVARCCIVDSNYLPARVNQHVSIIRTNENILPEFMVYYLISPKMKSKLLYDSSGNATREAITKSMIEAIEVPVLSKEIQLNVIQKIKESFRINNNLIEVQTHKLNHLKALKSSLLDQAFKGEL